MSDESNPFVTIIKEAVEAAQEGSLDPSDAAALMDGIAEALEAIVRSDLVGKWWARASLLAAAAALHQLADSTKTDSAGVTSDPS